MLLVLAGAVHTISGRSFDPGALLVRRGRIIAVGAADDVRREAAGAAVLDLRPYTLTPGLTDAHAHLLEWALSRAHVQLAGAASPQEAARLAAAATPAGEWVLGGGWNPHAWSVPPAAPVLDAAVPGRPVALRSHDLHALWVSSEAMRRAGIDASTPDPERGVIVRGEDGAPTGLLLEDAARLVLDLIPPAGEEAAVAAVAEAQAELHRLGITGVHSMEMESAHFRSLGVYQRLEQEDRLRLRVLQHLPRTVFGEALALGLRSGYGSAWLRIGALKLFLDGALGSRTAHLREPYEGTAERGIEVLPPDVFREYVGRAAGAGISVAVHAIGDAAIDTAIAPLADPAFRPGAIPHRIEHVQLCAPDQIARVAASGVVCSMQPAHLITDWRPAERHWGAERSRGAYAFASLLRAGAALAFGSDVPVEPVDPRLGFYAATERCDLGGEPNGGWNAMEKLTMAQTLRAYTVGPAHAAGRSGRSGVLAAGADADFVAWDRDPMSVRGRELLELRCVATVVGGEVVWQEEQTNR